MECKTNFSEKKFNESSILVTVCFLLAILGIFCPDATVFGDIEDPPGLSSLPWSGWWWPYNNEYDEGPTLYMEAGPLNKYDLITGLHESVSSMLSETAEACHGRWHGPNQNVDNTGNGDAWAVASLQYPEPTSVTDFMGINLRVSDKKGLLCAISSLYESGSMITKDSPGNFWRALRTWIRDNRKGLIADIYTEVPDIWGTINLPIYDYRAEFESLGDDDRPLRHQVKLTVDYASCFVGEHAVGTTPYTLEYTFEIDLDENGTIIGDGIWTGTSAGYSESRPERVWTYAEPMPWNSRLDRDTVLFLVQGGDVEIVSPSVERSVIVGSSDSPVSFTMALNVRVNNRPVTGLHNKNIFEITVGSKPATVLNMFQSAHRIYLEVLPPTQASSEKYDLTLKVGDIEIFKEDWVRYLKEGNVDIPLIIDRSGSMGSYGYMEPAKEAASLFVDFMEMNDSIGVVSFQSYADVNYPLTFIDNQDVKTEAKAAISTLSASGSTSIGAGLAVARDELNTSGITDHNWAMVLLSDGYENTSSLVDDVLPTIPEEVRIFSVALGPNSDQELLNMIATETDGEYFMAPDSDALNEIYANISGKISGDVILDINTDIVMPDEEIYSDVRMDSSFTKATFYMSFDSGDVGFELVEPGGRVIDPDEAATDLRIFYEEGDDFRQYIIFDPSFGTWLLVAKGTDVPTEGTEFTTVVRGRTKLRLNDYLDKPSYNQNEPILVAVSIFDEEDSIKGMDVRADVAVVVEATGSGMFEMVNGDLVEIPLDDNYGYEELDDLRLYDDGQHGDGKPHDGVYANYWMDTEMIGISSCAITSGFR